MASVEQVRGYILEEVLARLIKSAGYDLLQPLVRTGDLKPAHHGLEIRGRGAWHQVDVLGQFRWTPPFNFPIRLFLEAKFKKPRIGVSYVRQAIGTTSDINSNVSPINLAAEDTPLSSAFRYSYALASTSGFTEEAAKLALAHQISLIDLGQDEYAEVLDRVNRLATAFCRQRGRNEKSLSNLRTMLRSTFHTLPAGIPRAHLKDDNRLRAPVSGLREAVDGIEELYLGTANGPFILLLKADNPATFLEYCQQRPRHEVRIHWTGPVEAGQTWVIRPTAHFHGDYRLRFRLPEMIANWIIGQGRATKDAAFNAKQQFLSKISIHHVSGDRDELFQLEFDPEATARAPN